MYTHKIFKTGIHRLEYQTMRTFCDKVFAEKEELQKQLDQEQADREAERQANAQYTPVAIVNSRGIGSKTEFKVRWMDDSETWEPRSYVNAPGLYTEWRNKRKAKVLRKLKERKKLELQCNTKRK